MAAATLKQNSKDYFWSRLIAAFFFLGLVLTLQITNFSWAQKISDNYLFIHTGLEFIGMLISFSIFTVGWATYENTKSSDILVLSLVSFVVGCLDLGHLFSYPGMPDLLTANSVNKSTWFAMICRLIGAFGFLYISLAKTRKPQMKHIRLVLMALALSVVASIYLLILYRLHLLPTLYISGQGLTEYKMALEGLVVVVAFVSGMLFFRKGFKNNNFNLQWLACGCAIFSMNCYFLMVYRSSNDFYNFMGHVYKAASFLVIYRAVFVECVSKPYAEARLSAEQAVEANSSKSRFLANVSHEFRTPLGVISGFSDMLVETKSLNQESQKWVQTISRNAKQLRILIDDLLDLAKAENEKINIELSFFNPAEEIENTVNSLKLQAEKKGIRIRFQNELASDVKIASDRLRFCQILFNIIGNAVKFTSVGEVVLTLKASETVGKFEVQVKDSGIGMNSNQAERLFQPFVQVQDTASRRFGGTGLGLALSKKLSALLGGDLWLESSYPGGGSIFCFSIEDKKDLISNEKLESKNVKMDSNIQFDFAKLTILAAEDSIDNQSLLELYLQPTHAKLMFAQDGNEALRLAVENRFDLILMDIQMPEMDGFEAVSRLRSQGWQGPIVALSAHAHSAEKERALKNGFDDYLTKPITREKLWERIQFHTLMDF